MAGINVKVIGLKEFERKLDAMGDALGKEHMNDILREAAGVIAAEIRVRTPVLKAPTKKRAGGELRRSITYALSRHRPLTSFTATERKLAFYGRFLEYGTVKMAARPFFRPGVAAGRPIARRLILKGMEYLLQRAMQRAA